MFGIGHNSPNDNGNISYPGAGRVELTEAFSPERTFVWLDRDQSSGVRVCPAYLLSYFRPDVKPLPSAQT
jgi:hypothetical protein